MQRFTVKLSFQPGRKLGLILVDSPLESDPYSDPESEFDSEDDAILHIRGGGSTVQTNDQEPGAGRDATAGQNSNDNNTVGESSLQMKFAVAPSTASVAPLAQAAKDARETIPKARAVGSSLQIKLATEAAAKAAQAMKDALAFKGARILKVAQSARAAHATGFAQVVKVSRVSKPAETFRRSTIHPRVSKRKRPTTHCVSDKSIVFKFAEKLLAASTTPSSPIKDEKRNLCLQHAVDPSNIDALVEWGRENVPPIALKGGTLMTLKEINIESFKFALTNTIMPGDIMEKIQYTRSSPPTKAKPVIAEGKGKYDARKRHRRPYFRSDHYTTFYCENKPATDLASILKSSQNFPLYVTFKRRVSAFHTNGLTKSTNGPNCNSPPRKRLRTSASNIVPIKCGASMINHKPSNEVICLLDSSDEEDVEMGREEARTDICEAIDMSGVLPQARMEVDSSPKSSSAQRPQSAPPDPRHMPFDDDDFVLTPFGPGKILSTRVERYASSNSHSDATIFNPTIIYTIDLHFGICHVPARQVKSISGTPYTEKSVITFQRVPLNEHDLLRLRPMTYLNDSIIMFYLKYLKMQLGRKTGGEALTQNRGWDDLDGEGIHIFPSFAYTRIKNLMGPGTSRNSKANRTKIWSDLKTWTRGVDIFKKKMLVFPVNESLHWTCVFVCHPGRAVRRYAKDLARGKANTTILESKTSVSSAPRSTTSPIAKVESSNGRTGSHSLNNDRANESQAKHAVDSSGRKEKAIISKGTMASSDAYRLDTDIPDVVSAKPLDGGAKSQNRGKTTNLLMKQATDLQERVVNTSSLESTTAHLVAPISAVPVRMMEPSDGGSANNVVLTKPLDGGAQLQNRGETTNLLMKQAGDLGERIVNASSLESTTARLVAPQCATSHIAAVPERVMNPSGVLAEKQSQVNNKADKPHAIYGKDLSQGKENGMIGCAALQFSTSPISAVPVRMMEPSDGGSVNNVVLTKPLDGGAQLQNNVEASKLLTNQATALQERIENASKLDSTMARLVAPQCATSHIAAVPERVMNPSGVLSEKQFQDKDKADKSHAIYGKDLLQGKENGMIGCAPLQFSTSPISAVPVRMMEPSDGGAQLQNNVEASKLLTKQATALQERIENASSLESTTARLVAPQCATSHIAAVPDRAMNPSGVLSEKQSQDKDKGDKSHAIHEKGVSKGKENGKTGCAPLQFSTSPISAVPVRMTKPSDGGSAKQYLNNNMSSKPHATHGEISLEAKQNTINLASTMTGSCTPQFATNPIANATVMKSFNCSSANQSLKSNTPKKTHATNGKSVTDNRIQHAIPHRPKWRCDYCKEAIFDVYNDALEHEKVCEKNIDWCIIHFDSGKHFKLHDSKEINGNVRKYLNAYYDAEYASTHPGLSCFTMKNMPGFSAAVPQQDNTKDCGVYMLENCERMLRHAPLVSNSFIKTKGVTRNNFFGKNAYKKSVIDMKRDDILQLIQSMRRGENRID